MPGIDDRRKIIQISLAWSVVARLSAASQPPRRAPPRAAVAPIQRRARSEYAHTHTRDAYAPISIVVRRVHTSYTMACDGDDDDGDYAHGKRNSRLSSDVLLLDAPLSNNLYLEGIPSTKR